MSNTVTLSPKRQLEAYFASLGDGTIRVVRGLDPAAQWLGYRHRVGDIVREKDGRHLGRIDAIINSVTAKVTWLDTGWKQELPLADLVIVDKER